MKTKSWIGVDFDGTLARYDGWKGVGVIGEPIPLMVERVKKWIDEGKQVKIFTARVAKNEIHRNVERKAIEKWLENAGIKKLEVTSEKDHGMTELWDDRAVAVERNTGEKK